MINWSTAVMEDEQLFYRYVEQRLAGHKPKTYRFADVREREAAVLIPFFFKAGRPHLLFTKRTEKVEHHKGQISFPGGMYDAVDANLRETALRETWEEMGIQPDDIDILGRTDNFLTNTHFLVTPYVGYFPYPYPFKINPDEIAHTIEVPLDVLMEPGRFEVRRWERDGVVWDIHYYHYLDEIIWGVTGFLLSNLLSIVFDITRMPDNPFDN